MKSFCSQTQCKLTCCDRHQINAPIDRDVTVINLRGKAPCMETHEPEAEIEAADIVKMWGM